MRSFPLSAIILCAAIYTLMSTIVFFAIRNLSLKKKYRRLFSFIYSGYTSLIVFFIIFLFIYPKNAGESENYSIYFVFNIFLINDIIIKLILTLFSFPYFSLLIFKKKTTALLFAGLILSTGISASVIWGALGGKNSIQINRVELEFEGLPDSFSGLKIVQLSDIHLGSFNNDPTVLNKVVKIIQNFKPGIILFTGDLVNNFEGETQGWRPVFSAMEALYGKFSILGNHDYGDYHKWYSEKEKEQNFNNIVIAHKEFGFRLLRNEAIAASNSEDSIYIVGVENWGHPPFPQYADLEKATIGIPKTGFNILMTHDPAHWEEKIDGKERMQLTLSGHTHGLQWGIKPGGIDFSLMYLMRKNWAGLYGGHGQYLYVNRGIGTIGLNFRLDMPAEVTLFTLKTK